MIVTKEYYEQYAKMFSEVEDKSAFFDKYYHPDVEFIHPFKGTFRGKKELVTFWNAGKGSGHDGIHEILKLKDIVSVEDKFAVELDIEWRCFKDTNYLGPRKKGDVFYAKCAGFFTIRDDKFYRVQLYLNLTDKPN